MPHCVNEALKVESRRRVRRSRWELSPFWVSAGRGEEYPAERNVPYEFNALASAFDSKAFFSRLGSGGQLFSTTSASLENKQAQVINGRCLVDPKTRRGWF